MSGGTNEQPVSADARAIALADSIRKQLDGSRLPTLTEFEGTMIVVRVAGGKLHWAAVKQDIGCW